MKDPISSQDGSSAKEVTASEATEDVTVWYQALQNGDEDAATQLFQHCFPRLLRYARSRLPAHLCRALDEEDVALSAFKSLCRGAQKGALDSVNNRDELWKLLTCITARKGMAHLRHETRQKRGGGKTRGESIFIKAGEEPARAGIDQVPGNIADPAVLAEFEDGCQSLLNLLNDETLQAIALLRMEGYSVDEISERIGCAKRTVERRLNLIRKTWNDAVEVEQYDDVAGNAEPNCESPDSKSTPESSR